MLSSCIPWPRSFYTVACKFNSVKILSRVGFLFSDLPVLLHSVDHSWGIRGEKPQLFLDEPCLMSVSVPMRIRGREGGKEGVISVKHQFFHDFFKLFIAKYLYFSIKKLEKTSN